jgi:hypothetical protein
VLHKGTLPSAHVYYLLTISAQSKFIWANSDTHINLSCIIIIATSWVQLTDGPTLIVGIPGVLVSIVETATSALPEFEIGRHYAIPSPHLGPFNAYLLRLVLPQHLLSPLLKLCLALIQWATLLWDCGIDLRFDGSLLEVVVRFLLIYLLHLTLYADLLLVLPPPETCRHVTVIKHLLALSTLIVGEEHEASLIHILQQHKPIWWLAILWDCR